MKTQDNRLHGKYIFLSASIPDTKDEQFDQFVDQATAADEAVLGLARGIFSAGGRLVFGAHPSISPLVAKIAGEYADDESLKNEPPVLMFQSKAFQRHIPEETLRLERLGWAKMVLTEAQGGEAYNPQDRRIASEQCPQSLAAMRREMISVARPVAMVCVCGKKGVIEEFEFFLEFRGLANLNAPIYLLRYTGGVTRELADRSAQHPRVNVLDVGNFLEATESYDKLIREHWHAFAPYEREQLTAGRRFVPNRLLGILVAEKIIQSLSQ
jgi:SLOG cluster2